MKHTDKRGRAATYPVTIHTPYGVLRLEYTFGSSAPCRDCGDVHDTVSYIEASPRLRTVEALPFVEDLPNLLLNLGRVADLSISTEILLSSSAARRA